MVRLFREIISACLALEQPLTVAYLGPEGTFTQAAALKHFGHSVNTLALPAIDVVFREVESGKAHYGVVPVENSTEGVVNYTLDMFLRSPLSICGEVELRVELHLLGKADSLAGIREVYAHHQALAQCREWLESHLTGVRLVAFSSNAEAARLAADVEGAAAIASEAAAARYGLKRLVGNIEDEPGNTTRFLIIGEHSSGRSGEDKTSLLVSVHNKPGALYRLLEPLVRHGISMTRIESRPSRRSMWDYVFFVDFEGHRDDPDVRTALSELESVTSLLRVLGSYPKAIL
jgi:chorismate mutase/prephenate dehydratase